MQKEVLSMKKFSLFFSVLMMLFTLYACEDNSIITVTFLGHNEALIETVEIDLNEEYTIDYPEAPHVDGYLFVRWDGDLENIQSDRTIQAVYEVFEASTELSNLLERVLKSENYSEHVEVYVNETFERTITFEREFLSVYMTLQRVGINQVRLYLDLFDDEYRGYEYQEEGWVYSVLEENMYEYILFSHSQRRMLPIEIDINWFTINGNVYTVKTEAVSTMIQYVPMQGHFNKYVFTVLDDALLLEIELYQGFELVRYEIRFDGLDETVVDVDLDE